MHKRSYPLSDERGAHFRAETIQLDLPDNGGFASFQYFTHNAFAFRKFQNLKRFWREAMTDTWHDLCLLFVPGEDDAAICLEHIHSHIYQRLKYLVQAYIAKDSFVCLVERLDFLVAFFQRTGSLSNQALQLAITVS